MKNLLRNKKFLLSTLLMAIGVTIIYAQPPNLNDNSGNELIDQLQTIGEIVYKIIFVIAGIAGLAGGITVAWAYWNSKENAPDILKKWVIGFVIILLLGIIVKTFTGADFS